MQCVNLTHLQLHDVAAVRQRSPQVSCSRIKQHKPNRHPLNSYLQLRDLAVFGEHLPPEALHHGVALRPLLFQLRQQRSILGLQPAAALLGFSERALLALVPGGVVVLKFTGVRRRSCWHIQALRAQTQQSAAVRSPPPAQEPPCSLCQDDILRRRQVDARGLAAGRRRHRCRSAAAFARCAQRARGAAVKAAVNRLPAREPLAAAALVWSCWPPPLAGWVGQRLRGAVGERPGSEQAGQCVVYVCATS